MLLFAFLNLGIQNVVKLLGDKVKHTASTIIPGYARMVSDSR